LSPFFIIRFCMCLSLGFFTPLFSFSVALLVYASAAPFPSVDGDVEAQFRSAVLIHSALSFPLVFPSLLDRHELECFLGGLSHIQCFKPSFDFPSLTNSRSFHFLFLFFFVERFLSLASLAFRLLNFRFSFFLVPLTISGMAISPLRSFGRFHMLRKALESAHIPPPHPPLFYGFYFPPRPSPPIFAPFR